MRKIKGPKKLLKSEPFNGTSHFIALGFAFIGSLAMAYKSKTLFDAIASGIFGWSMCILYYASSTYHYFSLKKVVYDVLRRFDHSSIYFLIAGTETAIYLLSFDMQYLWTRVIPLWLLAVLGTIYKSAVKNIDNSIFISTFVYILMGISPLMDNDILKVGLSNTGHNWLIAGGASYIIGTFFFIREDVRMLDGDLKWEGRLKKLFFVGTFSATEEYWDHEIFHIFTPIGSFCHWVVIFFYLL